jgi:hypothetical protein
MRFSYIFYTSGFFLEINRTNGNNEKYEKNGRERNRSLPFSLLFPFVSLFSVCSVISPHVAETGGRRLAHGLAVSSWAASLKRVDSSPNLPMKCVPMGNPSSFQ